MMQHRIILQQTKQWMINMWKEEEEKVMKEKYTTPEMEVIEFEVEDIITTSLNIVYDVNELPIK